MCLLAETKDLTTQSNPNIKISDTLKLINNPIDIFKGIIEIVYKIRCHFVHGQLEPNENNHEVVKYCYFLLRVLMLF
jgi:hypothetical protein